ncbi:MULTISPECIES: PIG-L deacetylase family protein [unclassified Corallococcus]|uniref:PIG-L deacetylase family protein n=1 Tax=unclassified Corallococcus TaxID=2685029 RepID=UPI001A8FA7EC|nr:MULTISPECIES: PIG-L deacetylase family protein [unclassified Corallococcus]MBN9685634.1 PIG-L family deacetylase [Corallococcus sp. NCSPR001]WAS82920.1 PIG-L family deacetylase [Corallococcus sp. NCRR]
MMNGTPVRRALRRLQRMSLERRARAFDADALRRPAMVFAPHPDDETLGCGGTILQKRRVGATVRIVCLTDGAGSHPSLLPGDELKAMRAREVRGAAKVLEVEEKDVFLLGFPDRELDACREAAVARVAELLWRHRPEQLFVPYARGEHPDHVSTNLIVREAVERVGLPVTLYEYAVWAWRHWPMVGFEESRRSLLSVAVSTRMGLWMAREFRTKVLIRDVLARKRAALASHASQMERRVAEPRWHTLEDVDGGEFLACFFEDYELYRRIDIAAR